MRTVDFPNRFRSRSQFSPLRYLIQVLIKWRVLWISALAIFMLSGCVGYEVGVNFESPNQGTIVQHIKLGQQLTAFSNQTAESWLTDLGQRAKQLGGRVRKISGEEVVVTIPFASGAALEERFNQFFNPQRKEGDRPSPELSDIPNLKSHLTLQQTNWLVLIRNHLTYDIDLRSLGLLSANGNLLVDPGSLLDLKLGLNTPWGAQSLPTTHVASAETRQEGHALLWNLKPGEENHLEAVFWLPNPLGIGAIVILLVTVAGFYLRYQILSPPLSLDISPRSDESVVGSG